MKQERATMRRKHFFKWTKNKSSRSWSQKCSLGRHWRNSPAEHQEEKWKESDLSPSLLRPLWTSIQSLKSYLRHPSRLSSGLVWPYFRKGFSVHWKSDDNWERSILPVNSRDGTWVVTIVQWGPWPAESTPWPKSLHFIQKCTSTSPWHRVALLT